MKMANPNQTAPFTITGTASSDVNGYHVSVTLGPAGTLLVTSATATGAILAAARTLVGLGYDPTTSLTVGSVTLGDLSMAV
jgi:hypothetical protein